MDKWFDDKHKNFGKQVRNYGTYYDEDYIKKPMKESWWTKFKRYMFE